MLRINTKPLGELKITPTERSNRDIRDNRFLNEV